MNNTMEIKLPNAIYYGEERDDEGNITKPGEWTKDIEITESKGKDEDLLVSRARKGDGKGTLLTTVPARISKILSRVTVRVGKMKRPDGKTRDNAPDFFKNTWDKAFSSDRLFSMIRMREHTLGEDYDFSEVCPECKKDIPNIHFDLTTLKVSEKSLESSSCESHPVTLPRSKDKVDFRFFTGSDEEAVNTIMSKGEDGYTSKLFALRIVAVNDDDTLNKVQYVEDMSGFDRRYLASKFDEMEGGIESKLEIVCDNPNCGHEFNRKLQIMGKTSFFFPSVIRTSSSSTAAP
jgi:hypothetical protein